MTSDVRTAVVVAAIFSLRPDPAPTTSNVLSVVTEP